MYYRIYIYIHSFTSFLQSIINEFAQDGTEIRSGLPTNGPPFPGVASAVVVGALGAVGGGLARRALKRKDEGSKVET